MRVRKLADGATVEVGDRIRSSQYSDLHVSWLTVHRVTPKFAFVKYNDVSEGKFPRKANGFRFHSLPRGTWSTTEYSAWRPVDSTNAPLGQKGNT
jgi:hypothetical protein